MESLSERGRGSTARHISTGTSIITLTFATAITGLTLTAATIAMPIAENFMATRAMIRTGMNTTEGTISAGLWPDRVTEALKLIPKLRSLVERYRYMNHCVVGGRGINYGNAYEFALKLMETSYMIAERFSSADFLHGPIALIERDFPSFLFALAGIPIHSVPRAD